MTDTAERTALTRERLLDVYRMMRTIREFEERVHAEFATGTVPADGVTARAKLLEARVGDRAETALIDVAVSTERHVGSRAVWDPATLTQLFCAFAEPDAIGLSSILGQLSPVARHEPHGVTARLTPEAPRTVLAPIAPGLVVPVGVSEVERMRPGSVHLIDARAGVIAVDGERELTFEPGESPTVRLRADGPRCLDVPAVLAASARLGLLQRTRDGPRAQSPSSSEDLHAPTV